MNKRSTPTNSDIFFLHASSIEVSEKALIFLGHSSAGKSTIAKLLSKKYPLISDDKIYVYRKNNTWKIKDGDDKWFSQEERREASNSFPILAFVRIFKSNNNSIGRIKKSLLCKHLIDAVFEVDNQRNVENINIRKKWFHLTSDLAKKNQGWYFYFNKKFSIIKIIEETFEK